LRKKLHLQQVQRDQQQESGSRDRRENCEVCGEWVHRHWRDEVVAKAIEAHSRIHGNGQQTNHYEFLAKQQQAQDTDGRDCRPGCINIGGGDPDRQIRILVNELCVVNKVSEARNEVRDCNDEEQLPAIWHVNDRRVSLHRFPPLSRVSHSPGEN
jgi:hypothetical protein